MKQICHWIVLSGLGMMLSLCAGCHKPYTLQIAPGAGLGAVEIDVVAVSPNKQDKDLWEQISVDEYWRSGSPTNQIRQDRMNGGSLVNLKIHPGQTDVLQVLPTSKLWDIKPQYIVLICNLPGQQLPSALDRRRVLLPMKSGTWVDDTIQIRLQRSGFDILTPQKTK